MSTSYEQGMLLSTSLLGSVVAEDEEAEILIKEEIEHRLQRLAQEAVLRLRESYTSLPPRDARDAVRRAEEVIVELVHEEAKSIGDLLQYVDVEAFVREQAILFAEYVDKLYETLYSHGNRLDKGLEAALMTLTAVRILYLIAVNNRSALRAAQKAAALLLALRVLWEQRNLRIVSQLPQLARGIINEYVGEEEAS